MAFKEVSDLNAETTIALGGKNKQTGKDNPKQIEGYYLGSRQVDSKKSKSGKAYIYIFQTPKGNVGVWGKTDLDNKMKAAAPGCMIRITQNGMANTPNGEMYKYKVEVDDTNTIEVLGGDNQQSAQEETTGGYGGAGYGEEAEELDVEEEEVEYTPPPRNTATSQASAARVQALLNKGKR